VRLFAKGQDLLEALNHEVFDCLLLDLHMPGLSGFDVLREIGRQPAAPPVIIITGHDEPGTRERLQSFSAADYLLKPVDETALLNAIERCLGSTSPGNPARLPQF
jgi:CheY-like chemotaxis protein